MGMFLWHDQDQDHSDVDHSRDFNPSSSKIHIQILLADLHTFLQKTVERIWFKIKAFSLW